MPYDYYQPTLNIGNSSHLCQLTSQVLALRQGTRKVLPTASLKMTGSFWAGRSGSISQGRSCPGGRMLMASEPSRNGVDDGLGGTVPADVPEVDGIDVLYIGCLPLPLSLSCV